MDTQGIAPVSAGTTAQWQETGSAVRPAVPPHGPADTTASQTDRVELSALAQRVADHEATQLQLDPRILAALITSAGSPAAPSGAPRPAAGTTASPTTGEPTNVKGR
jgi:hypothetical protein